MGKRFNSDVSNAAPKTTSGIVVASPMTSSEMSTSPPILAAWTSAITLSSDITASATIMILTACQVLEPAFTFSSSSSSLSSSWTSPQAIYTSSNPPATCSRGTSNSKVMTPAKMILSTTAPAAPKTMAFFRLAPSRVRAAIEEDDRRHDEDYIEGPGAEHIERPQGGFAQQETQEDYARDDGEEGRKSAKKVELPRREEHPDRDRDGALEDHRPCDIADSQGVLIIPKPDDRVELLGQLRCQWREDQRDQARGHSYRRAEMLDGADEEVGAEAHHRDRPDQLRGDGPGRPLRAVRPEREPSWDVPFCLSALTHGPHNVDDVSGEQHHGKAYLQQQGQGQDACCGGQDKAEQEEQEVGDGGLPVGCDLAPRLPSAFVGYGRRPDYEQG